MRIYISGPIKGFEGTYRVTFKAAAQELREADHEVKSPVEAGDHLEEVLGRTPTYEEYMKFDISELLLCDAIYMLKGWERSVGARCEFHVAVLCGMQVIYQ